MRRLVIGYCLVIGIWCLVITGSPPGAMAADAPTMRGGFGKIVYGLVLELPMTVAEATMTNPPVVGTAVGLLAGVTRAVQTTFAGMVEVSQAFDPWGTKR